MKNVVWLVTLLITNSLSIYWFYSIGAKNQWVLDAPGRIILYEKILEESGSEAPGSKYLKAQIGYLRCDLADMRLKFGSVVKHLPVHESVYFIYTDAITKACKNSDCNCDRR